MIAEGREWQARDLATAADQIGREAKLSLVMPDGIEDALLAQVYQIVYAEAVRDVLRWIAGDLPESTPMLREIHQRFTSITLHLGD